ncbi:Polyribonucleotide nucleotidyltransferase [Blattabacterium sp. (Nauphoeta cinerea)]|uniref:polyribonucleotide nucleotidyltransferase n=1 Tax=Blattabacterium sp. (Nauphoeta cinerea) TaxID=1316444 RepID=UPI0003B0DCAD|nr:polyribonucleotide nucleotidyltransferase [Blattabacterium sp. (Nauphoeta cinerea)]AGW85886.1 Polyribonucleotide nucleotidyltransferase [Blattabacterium sp. (Nauphoeta cinerea)]
MLDIVKETISMGDGRTIIIETGRLARQADGAVIVRAKNTMLLATVVVSKETKKNETNFLPLTVDYREKYSAGGKIPGGFIKREGRPSDEEILTMRLVDRVLRPTFSDSFKKEIQIMISLLSYDKTVLPDGLAGLAASTALSVARIPFNGPISEIRVIRSNEKFIINPSLDQLKEADVDLIVGASSHSIIMIEGEMKETKEKEFLETVMIAHKAIKPQIEAQLRLVDKLSKSCIFFFDDQKSINSSQEQENKMLKEELHLFSYEKIEKIYQNFLDKKTRSVQEKIVLNDFKRKFLTKEKIEGEEKEAIIDQFFEEIKKNITRNLILNKGVRLDGRTKKQIRSISSFVDYLPGVHGSALFSRGETQSLATVTLGSSLDANRIDNVVVENQEKFYLHYNFPPFSTGEIRSIRGVSRREVGHGNLAQRALKNVIPNNPYTIRVVSDILESNGSSSMATVCAASLALMDAGIPIKNPVSGIAMGLFMENEKKIIVSDIIGEEDHFGDLDFKITGTKYGMTACQMDVKTMQGVTYDLMNKILMQALEGRIFILNKMLETLPKYRKKMKPNAPKIYTLNIPKDFIGSVIGPGGKVIQEIQSYTNTNIFIEEKGDSGYIEIIGKDDEKIEKAISRIKKIVFVPELGKVYKAKVKSIKDFGAFVEISKGVEGLLHISEIGWKRLNNIEEELHIGDIIDVKFMGMDEKNKKMKLSRKVLLPRPIKK